MACNKKCWLQNWVWVGSKILSLIAIKLIVKWFDRSINFWVWVWSRLKIDFDHGKPDDEPLLEVTAPKARYGHAMGALEDGFVLYGGQFADGSLSDDFFYFDASRNEWTLLAGQSQVRPPPLTRHTLCVVNDSLIYIFGGSMANGEFSSKLFRVQVNISGKSFC
jgi:hypothetical protein